MVIPLSLLFLALNVADIILTNKILAKGGVEYNPLMAKMMLLLKGAWWVFKVVLMLIVLALVCFMPEAWRVWFLIGANVVYIIVIINNWKESRK